jgi:hypothetical protein
MSRQLEMVRGSLDHVADEAAHHCAQRRVELVLARCGIGDVARIEAIQRAADSRVRL